MEDKKQLEDKLYEISQKYPFKGCDEEVAEYVHQAQIILDNNEYESKNKELTELFNLIENTTE